MPNDKRVKAEGMMFDVMLNSNFVAVLEFEFRCNLETRVRERLGLARKPVSFIDTNRGYVGALEWLLRDVLEVSVF